MIGFNCYPIAVVSAFAQQIAESDQAVEQTLSLTEIISFRPAIDIPLCLAVMVTFVLHFNHWAKRGDVDTNLDLLAELPVARLKVIFLLVGLLLCCWQFNLAFWSLFLLAAAAGIVIGAYLVDLRVGGVFIAVTATMIREWAFNFPQFVLHPGTSEPAVKIPVTEFQGQQGVACSPLRPCGEIEIDGKKLSAISDSGMQIENGTVVIVTGKRNGNICVRPVTE